MINLKVIFVIKSNDETLHSKRRAPSIPKEYWYKDKQQVRFHKSIKSRLKYLQIKKILEYIYWKFNKQL